MIAVDDVIVLVVNIVIDRHFQLLTRCAASPPAVDKKYSLKTNFPFFDK